MPRREGQVRERDMLSEEAAGSRKPENEPVTNNDEVFQWAE